MYLPSKSFLWSEVSFAGMRSVRETLVSNGTYLRGNSGQILGRETKKYPHILYFATCNDEWVNGYITDKVLVKRILCYWNEYFGVRYTNCSAFAHYLTTGQFVECEQEKRLLVINQGMRPYEMANRVDVGDMLCLLYADKKITSRKHSLAPSYRKVQKHHMDKGGFAGTKNIRMQQRSFSPKEIRRLDNDPSFGDYHFMVCVAKYRGMPVWLSQSGHVPPNGSPVPFTVTVGDFNPYQHNVPVLAMIKKRR